MALTLTDIGADAILTTYFNNTRPAGGNNLTMKLFVNDKTPADTDVAGDYTEAAGGGYAAIALTNGSWTVDSANDPSLAAYAKQTWTFTGALDTNPTVYGYLVVDADGTLLWAERLTDPRTPSVSGDFISVTPRFQLSNGTPA